MSVYAAFGEAVEDVLRCPDSRGGLSRYLFVDGVSLNAGCIEADLSALTERHKVELAAPSALPIRDVLGELERSRELQGIVIGMSRGWLERPQLHLARRALGLGRRVYLYWPKEEALECVDDERLGSHWRHWLLIQAWSAISRDRVEPLGDLAELARTLGRAAPIPLANVWRVPDPEHRIAGCGVYLRTDFWVSIDSGGSYGHTCFLCKALAAVSERLACFLPNRYALLDQLGVEQLVMPRPGGRASERRLTESTVHYYRWLKPKLEQLRPAFLYERLCLGNYAGARLSQELEIPYIVEYNGSEMSMRRSFGGSSYRYAEVFLQAEEAAFRQATLISVVSEPIRADLVRRGVDPGKLLVNPNGADLATYAPPPLDRKRAIRHELGFQDADRVIGFTGTFGAWHGIGVLAEALPRICRELPEARFLLIGDGSLKHLVDTQVSRHGLDARVRAVGRVPQAEGARLLQACDVYVAPHSGHMVDSPFFGSPTKVFEYMAMGGGIVASDLEQIGQVLSPALRVADLEKADVAVAGERAVLCAPGDLDEFVRAVVRLAARPDLCEALGRNARRAVAERYSWDRHVAKLWRALVGEDASQPAGPQSAPDGPAARIRPRLATGDVYKDEVQRQWDHNPVGSQYVKQASKHTLEWFLEVEAHRYGEYAPWMPETMEFARHAGEQVLEIGGGMGTDLAQFARHGALVTDVDLSAGHLELAQENFRLRGLSGTFIHHDAEGLPFEDDRFDLVYSNGVIHHTPNTERAVREILRVLKPGGRAIVMVYAENSLHYWRSLVFGNGLWHGMLGDHSMGDIMSRSVELSTNDARPLVKVYTRARVRRLFMQFAPVQILQRQLTAPELPRGLRWMPVGPLGRLVGWNLVVKAVKPRVVPSRVRP